MRKWGDFRIFSCFLWVIFCFGPLSNVPIHAYQSNQLDEKDLTATETTLQRAQHVVAVQQGENAWLMEIEGFLRDEAGTIGARLRASAP